MNILTMVEIIGVSTTFTLTLFGVCYVLRNVLGSVVFDNCCCFRLCAPVTDDPLRSVTVDTFRPQDYVFRNNAECPMDVTVVFIDQNEYQQMYLKRLKQQKEHRRVTYQPTAPPSPGPPPYVETV